MLIKSLKLENIRSYTNQVFEFPLGSVLLSGDIGSGKSSILSAIEFALFGIKRKELSGSSLLRHGAKQGSVELNFEVDGKNIVVKRNLKRGLNDVKQDTGYIITNDLKKEATAVELRSILFNLLGFPPDLVSKSKDLVYRYTVYTPQEQMKEILLGDVESRLDTLRRVFGIDKYKRIRANTFVLSRQLKDNINLFKGQISDLEEKKQLRDNKTLNINNLNVKIEEINPSLEKVKSELTLKKSELEIIEKDIILLNKLKNDINTSKANLANFESQYKRNKSQLDLIQEEDLKLREEIRGKEVVDTEFLKADIIKRKEGIKDLEIRVVQINQIIGALESKKQVSEALKQKIGNISQCPTCLQDVNQEHKQSIAQREDLNISKITKEIVDANSQKDKINNDLTLLRQGLEKVRKKESELSIIKLKQENIEEKEKNLERLKNENSSLKIQIDELNVKITSLNDNLNILYDSEKKYNLLKSEFDKLLNEEKLIEVNKAGFVREKETVLKFIADLDLEINTKLETKNKLTDLVEKENWLSKHFMHLMMTIEKHVMLRIHNEFNELFREWFNLLIEDESLNARLDDSFTPIIEQNGYDTEFHSLSGGERTSLALAYRLSLNKVINDLITTIKMNDLIILDEPTDGFSNEQLDRVRVVLDQLNLKQVIIVSHESKMEGFVDNIIRINKENHVSGVYS